MRSAWWSRAATACSQSRTAPRSAASTASGSMWAPVGKKWGSPRRTVSSPLGCGGSVADGLNFDDLDLMASRVGVRLIDSAQIHAELFGAIAGVVLVGGANLVAAPAGGAAPRPGFVLGWAELGQNPFHPAPADRAAVLVLVNGVLGDALQPLGVVPPVLLARLDCLTAQSVNGAQGCGQE